MEEILNIRKDVVIASRSETGWCKRFQNLGKAARIDN